MSAAEKILAVKIDFYGKVRKRFFCRCDEERLEEEISGWLCNSSGDIKELVFQSIMGFLKSSDKGEFCRLKDGIRIRIVSEKPGRICGRVQAP